MIDVGHLAIRAQNLGRSRYFYEEGLRLTFLGHRPSGVAMDLSDGAVNLTLLHQRMTGRLAGVAPRAGHASERNQQP